MNFDEWYVKAKDLIGTEEVKNALLVYKKDKWFPELGKSLLFSEIAEAAGSHLSDFADEKPLIRQIAGACILFGYFVEINKGKVRFVPHITGVGRGLNNLWANYPENKDEIIRAFRAAIDAGLKIEWLIDAEAPADGAWKVDLKRVAADIIIGKSTKNKIKPNSGSYIPTKEKVVEAIQAVRLEYGEAPDELLKPYLEKQAQAEGHSLHPDWWLNIKETFSRKF